MKNKNILRLTESGVMIAVAVVLSLLKLVDLPYGGSITLFSMVPVAIIAYRYGTKWGFVTGLVFGVVQALLGIKAFSYVTGFVSVVAVLVLDYLAAFCVIGLAGAFRGKFARQEQELAVGVLLACVARYICHVVSGCTVWAGLSIPTKACLIYSIGYNATYMIPETIISVAGAFFLASALDFRGEHIVRLRKENRQAASFIMEILSVLSAFAGIAVISVMVFLHIQNPETGAFDITLLSQINWLTVGIIAAATVLVWGALALTARTLQNKSSKQA